jgi:hypothetical protein
MDYFQVKAASSFSNYFSEHSQNQVIGNHFINITLHILHHQIFAALYYVEGVLCLSLESFRLSLIHLYTYS